MMHTDPHERTPEPSDWATARYGDQAAHAYGVVWLTVPEEILARLLLIEGATVIHPARARYMLGVLNGSVMCWSGS